MRKNKSDYTWISLEISRRELEAVMAAMRKEGLKSRSQLVRNLLYCWAREVGNGGDC